MVAGCADYAPVDALLLLVILGAATAGFVQGLSGFAFGLVAMAFWAWSVSPQLAGPMVVFGSLVGQLLALPTIRRGFRLDRVLPFIIGGLAGVPFGVFLLRNADPLVFKLVVGVLLVVYCPTLLFARDLPRIAAGGRLADGAAGLVGGVMGGLGGFTAPVPTLWCMLRGWDRDVQRSVFQTFNLTMHAFTLAAYAAAGVLTAESGRMFAIVAPAMLLPTLLGARLYGRFREAAFRRVVLVLLTVSGVVLLSATVPELLRRAGP